MTMLNLCPRVSRGRKDETPWEQGCAEIPSESRRHLMGRGEGEISVLESYKFSKVNLYFYSEAHSA